MFVMQLKLNLTWAQYEFSVMKDQSRKLLGKLSNVLELSYYVDRSEIF